MKKVEHVFENLLFKSRWILAPFFVGLVLSCVMLLIKFGAEFLHLFIHIFELSESEVILGILTLIDIALIASLLMIITFSGYESFVSKFDIDDHEDRPVWMGKVGFSALKIKVIGSIVAISAIELLKVFINITPEYQSNDYDMVMWKVIIHLAFVISGVLFAVMDKTSSQTN